MPRSRLSSLLASLLHRPTMRVESLALIASLFFTLFCNRLFIEGMLADYDLSKPASWLVATALFVILITSNFLLLGILLNRWTAKPLLTLLLLTTAFAVYYMNRYHVYLDPDMLRNVLATDVHEASDLMTWAVIPHVLLFAGVPIWLLSRIQLIREPLRQAIPRRLGALLLAILLGGGATLLIFQDFASQMRNHKELRYLITPSNYLFSLGVALRGEAQSNETARLPIGTDATQGSSWAARKKPALLVLVVGETVRAANWGLSGYARQTTPELAELGVINFASVTSCGSNTEVSLPCMFSPWGRRQYDEKLIRGSESLLDVAARAGFRVVWIDNQSGCKNVCKGVEEMRPQAADTPTLCDGERCLDAAMLKTLEKTVASTPGNLLVVMHQMGNHGPAYFKRYPDAFKHYTPACEDADLAHCKTEAIVNAYDNAIRYTDHVVADVVRYLGKESTHDAALIYVSDHGESLGENGLFLHGIPYAIAPDVQTRVPMVMWLSPGYASSFSLNPTCVSERAKSPVAHDNLFHTVLGMLDVKTTVYEEKMDFSAACRHPLTN